MNENKHGNRKLTPAISLKYGQTGWHKPANRRSRPFSVTWPNLDLNVFTSQIKQSSEIKVSVFSLTCWKDHSILRQKKNESPTNKLFRLFAEIASDTWFTLFFWKTVRVCGNTKLNWVVINELRKTHRIDSNKRRPRMSGLMWLIRSGKRLRNNFFSRWLFLFLWLFNKII